MNRDEMLTIMDEAVDFIYKNHQVNGLGLPIYSQELVMDITSAKSLLTAKAIQHECFMLHSPLLIEICKTRPESISSEKDMVKV